MIFRTLQELGLHLQAAVWVNLLDLGGSSYWRLFQVIFMAVCYFAYMAIL
jgi:hypothetical protein